MTQKFLFLSLAALLTLAACEKKTSTYDALKALIDNQTPAASDEGDKPGTSGDDTDPDTPGGTDTPGGNTEPEPEPQEENTVSWKGVKYKTVGLKDGNTWFAENLRYVPEGFTPSDDLTNVTAGIYYPVVVNADNTALAFSKDGSAIAARGYLYQAEVALGLKLGDLTDIGQANALAGAQGLCPDGWHIPTLDDLMGLVGKCSGCQDNRNAPYYSGSDGSLKLLNEDGFNMDAFGAISIQDNTKTTATMMGHLNGYPSKTSSGMFCGSTYAGVTYNTAGDASSGIKNLQFYGFMPMTNKATEAEYTCNGTKVSYRIAAPVRCVKNK